MCCLGRPLNAKEVDNFRLHKREFFDGIGLTIWAKPASCRNSSNNRAKAIHMVTSVTFVAEQHFIFTIAQSTFFTDYIARINSGTMLGAGRLLIQPPKGLGALSETITPTHGLFRCHLHLTLLLQPRLNQYGAENIETLPVTKPYRTSRGLVRPVEEIGRAHV